MMNERLETMEKPFRKIFRYLEILDENRFSDIKAVENITVVACDYKSDNTFPALDKFKPFKKDDTFGTGADTHAWFHFEVEIEDENTVLYINTEYNFNKYDWNVQNPQFILYDNKNMKQGLDINHRLVFLTPGKHDIYVYACTGMLAEKSHFYVEKRRLDPDINGLYYDISYPFETIKTFLDRESGEYAEVEKYLFNAVSMLDLYDLKSQEFLDSVKRARNYLSKEFYGKYCSSQNATVNCIGHTHIDCAWQWRFKQTREKVQRSFCTVLDLMEHYPEYKFMSSQALLYKFFKEEAPKEKWEEIVARVKEGRWEVEGSMWVEADCNLTSGESLVRQVVYGKNFFKKEFGVENHILWLPDVFGYSAALPQILRKSGVDWFVTSKISWNDTNRMPYDTFSWKGIDGTEINSFFLTAQYDKGGKTDDFSTYVGYTDASMISGTYKRYQQKNLNNEVLLTYGIGDGGGGTTVEMVETLRRGKNGMPGLPNARPELVNNFLKRVEKKISNNPELPMWQGELYLEFHRGTYTTQARNKRNNRKSEILYQNAETLASLSKILFNTEFPKQQLHNGWELILNNQFHDVIPGSSIKEVYQDSEKDYETIAKIGNKVVEDAQKIIASKIDKNSGYVVFNNTSFEGRGIVKVDGESVYVDNVPSKGYIVTDDFIKGNNIKINGKVVETKVLKVKFDDNWHLKSVFDKIAKRDVIKGEGNQFRLYADHPNMYDAWEWEEYSRDNYKVITDFDSVEVIEDGIRKGVKIVRSFNNSKITQTIWFTDDKTVIDFETEVDWHEKHNMLKAVFPTDINSDKATFEIQFGNVERPTHLNTSWDRAKFETCAQKWADLSDGGYGVSILNDCKYGHDIHDGVIQLSLLRASSSPDPDADQGKHTFTYSIYSHKGALNQADTIKNAYALNNPMSAKKATGDKTSIKEKFSLISIDKENIVCETVKEEENGNATIFRLYESKNIRTNAKIKLADNFTKVYVTDIMENKIKELAVKNGVVKYEFKGFEILTLKAE